MSEVDDTELLYRTPLAWARARRVVPPDVYYRRLSASARAMAFSIAGIARLDALEAIRKAIEKAISGGETFAQWRERIRSDRQAAQAALLPQHRLDNIFRTNMQAAYMRGIAREQEAPESLRLRPFFQYDAINDSRTRPSHAAMDNYIAPADDPVWRRWTPPAGYRCRCTRIALTEAQARARGWTGQPKPIPEGAAPDSGFAHHPLDEDGWKGIEIAIAERRRACRIADAAFGGNASGRSPIWCTSKGAMDQALLMERWTERKGDMPEPRRLVLPPMRFASEEEGYEVFMRALGLPKTGGWISVLAEQVFVDRSLFNDVNGDWKWFKNARSQWSLYTAETIRDPQEVWVHTREQSQDLYFFSRHLRGNETIETMAIFTRPKSSSDSSLWANGKTAYAANKKDYVTGKRQWLLSNKAGIMYLAQN